jgi:type III restriction enzyme
LQASSRSVFGVAHPIENRKKSIMQPIFNDGRSKLEDTFIEYLESPNKVAWWFKNSDRDAVYFAVPYEEDGDNKPFYIDFIVQMKDGSLGLFDTKAGLTQKVAAPKQDGLCTYIKEHNKKGKKLFGGIVTNTDQRNYEKRWVYFDKDSKSFTNNLANWENLIL